MIRWSNIFFTAECFDSADARSNDAEALFGLFANHARVQGGSQTRSTVASPTPSSAIIFCFASAAIMVPMPQPGAVNVIFTATLSLLISTS
mgnify:CR=1 FL=1